MDLGDWLRGVGLENLVPYGELRAEAGRGAGRGCAAPRLGDLEDTHDYRTEDHPRQS